MFFPCRDEETDAGKQKINLFKQVTAPFFYPAGLLPLESEFKTELVPSFQGRRLLKAAKLEAVLGMTTR